MMALAIEKQVVLIFDFLILYAYDRRKIKRSNYDFFVEFYVNKIYN